MAPEPSSLTRLARLLRETDMDTEALDARAQETSELLQRWPLERAELTLLAVNLHGYYTGLEILLERVANLHDQEVPTGPTWHVDLVEQMQTDVPGLRPALIGRESVSDLHELRKFRHFFRNAYVLKLDPTRVHEQAMRLVQVHPAVRARLASFRGYLQNVIAALGA